MGNALRLSSVVAVTFLSLWSCGGEEQAESQRVASAPPAADAQLAQADAQVRACGTGGAPVAALTFNLLAGETYAGSVVPIVTSRCAGCHQGDGGNGQPNSTTCGYLEKNIDNVLARLNNNVKAYLCRDASDAWVAEQQAPASVPNPPTTHPCYTGTVGDNMGVPTYTALGNTQIRNWASSGSFAVDARDVRPMPVYDGNNNRRMTQADIDVLAAWRDVPNKCVDTSTADAPLPDVAHYTDDDEQAQRLNKMFQGEACQDGPAVAADRAVVEGILALPADSPSAYYDYTAREFVAGARKAEGNCSIDYFIDAVAPIPGAQDVLKKYKEFGWWVTQCAVVNGRPQAYLAHVARVTTALGDKTYGVFLKPLRIKD